VAVPWHAMSSTPRQLRSAAASLAAVFVVVASGWSLAVAAAPADVEVVDYGFAPADVTVAVGEPVRWRWTGQDRHSVTAAGAFDSHPSCTPVTPQACGTTSTTFSWTADAPGTVDYRCKLHPERMQGTITVVDAAPSPSGAASPTAPPPTPSPEPSPAPSPEPSPTAPSGTASPATPSPSPTAASAPTPSASPAPAGVTTPTPSSTPATAASPSAPDDGPDLEPFPDPSDGEATPADDPLDDDVVAVGGPQDGGLPPAKIAAGALFGLTLLAVGRWVLFAPPW
jgi:plastocyanin